jgi:hypothetical protein
VLELEDDGSIVVNPWLIEISCCRLFTPTNCVIYAFGSVGWVGSWFLSSLTSNVRKSLDVMSDVSVEEAVGEELAPVAFAVADDFAVFAVALLAAGCGAIAEATVVDDAEPTPVIELV